MPAITAVAGLLLILTGAVGFGLSDDYAKTALIPAGFGVVLLVLAGVASRGGSARKHAMHGAAMVGTLGFLAAAGRLAMVLSKGTGTPLARGCSLAMALICAVFVAFCVKSFIDARRAREAGTQV